MKLGWLIILAFICCQPNLSEADDGSTKRLKASKLLIQGSLGLANFVTIETGYIIGRDQLEPYYQSLKLVAENGDPKNGAFDALENFLKSYPSNLRQQQFHQDAINDNAGLLFICLRDHLRDKQSKQSVDFTVNILRELSKNHSDWKTVSQLKWDCLDKNPSSKAWTPEDSENLDIEPILSHLHTDPFLNKVRALIQTFFFPKLISCNEFSVTEVLEHIPEQWYSKRKKLDPIEHLPWRWGMSVCIREDGESWRETLKGVAIERFDTHDPISDALNDLMTELGGEVEAEIINEEKPDESEYKLSFGERVKLFFFPKRIRATSYFSNGGVTFRWQKWNDDGRQLSETEQDFSPILFSEGIFSCVRDTRFQLLFNESPVYAYDFGGYSLPFIGGLRESRGYVYANNHRRLHGLRDNGVGIYHRFFHEQFKFYPFDADPDEQALIDSQINRGDSSVGCTLDQ